MGKAYTEHETQELKDKTDFLSRMSHELFTPLNAIVNMSHIAAAANDMAKIKSCISTIHDSSTQMLGIINDVLDMSRIELGRISLVNLPFELEKALSEARNIVRVRFDGKGQALKFDIEESVPPKLRGDEFHLTQLITNLLKNAIKFNCENSEIKVKVKSTGHTSGKATLEFCIACTGTDAPGENREQLESAFRQLNSDGHLHYGEIELSLIICKRIAEMMGGNIWIDDSESEGIALKLAVQMDVFEYDGKAASYVAAPTEDFGILFVDYDIGARDYFQNLMVKHGLCAVCAEDGEGAIKLVEDAAEGGRPFSAVFIDYHMPNLSGVETAKRVRETCGEDAVVISVPISEWALVEEKVNTEGFKEFLPKPFVDSQIMDIIGRIAAKKNLSGISRKEHERPAREKGGARSYEEYLPYIDVNEGLASVGGNKKLFATMLGSFLNGDAYADLKRSLDSDSMAEAQRYYATLKTVAANLSLAKLHKMLVRFEGQVRNKKINIREDILPLADEMIAETNQKINELLSEWE